MSKVKIQGNASGTGVLTVTAPNTSTDRTITLPDSTGTLATTADSVGGANGVDFNDNVKARFGTGDDLEIYHDGSNSYISDAGTGILVIRSDTSFQIQAANGEAYFNAVKDAETVLYHNDVRKFETTANGVTVTGTAVATTDTDATNTGSVTLDFATNQNFVLTLTGNVTLANPTTEQVGQSGFITFIQDGTGSRTVSLGTDYETAGGAGLTLTSTASATDIVPYVVVASGRILLGTPQLAFA